jgi:hypothetical protein
MTSAKEVVGSHFCVEVKIKCCDVGRNVWKLVLMRGLGGQICV